MINKNGIDKDMGVCYKYICSLLAIVPDFEQKYKTSFDNETAGVSLLFFRNRRKNQEGENSHVHFYGKQGQYRPQVVRR